MGSSKSEDATRTMASSSSSSSRRQSSNDRSFCYVGMSRTVMLRTLLIVSLLMAVFTCATLSYYVLFNMEQEVGCQRYESIASSALANARSITTRKLQGSELMATLMGQVLPEASNWPLIEMKGYIPIAQKVAQLSLSHSQSLVVILENPTPQEQADFEAHMQEQYKLQGRPEHAGMLDFGFGIWKQDTMDPTRYEDGRLHDVSVDQSWGGKHKVLIPVTFQSQPDAPNLMLNMYSEEARGIHFDSISECIAQHLAHTNTTTSSDTATNRHPSTPKCPVVTDILELKRRPGPAAHVVHPIFPANAPTKLVGLSSTLIQ
jgi:hypothetical protein